MKRLPILLCLCLLLAFVQYAQAQGGNIDLTLQLKNDQGRPIGNKTVLFTDLRSGKQVKGVTDGSGIARVRLEGGEVWQIAVDKIRDYWFWQIDARRVPEGRTGQMRKIITYNYERYVRETRPVPDRSNFNFTHQRQQFNIYDRPEAQHVIFRLSLTRADKRTPAANVPVTVRCFASEMAYDATTDGSGNAVFKLPINHDYDIDVADIQHFSYVDIDNKGNQVITKSLTYEPTEIKERNVGDTIFQQLPAKINGTSTHEAIYLTVTGGPDRYWKQEPIMLEVIKGNKIYKGYTDADGKVRFLLPKRKKYMIHGRFQRDIDVIDLTRARGIGYADKTIYYQPIPKYQYPERYIPRPQDLILISFDKFIEKQLPKPKPGESLKTYAKFGGEINANSQQAVLELGFAAEPFDEDYTGGNINIALVVDKSGSMAGYDRIESLREALIAFVEKLRPGDMVSLIVFESYQTIIIPAQKVTQDKSELIHEISMIEAGGFTNIYDGLIAGYEEVKKHFRKNRPNRVILLTDGYGSKPVEEVVEKSKSYNDEGIELSAVGVGEDYNVAMLKLLASHGGGLIELIKNAEDIREAFVKELSSLIMPIGKNAKVEITFNDQLLFAQLYGFPLEEKKPGKVVLKLPNIYAGLDHIGLIKFTLVNPTEAIEKEPVIIRTKFFDIRKNEQVVREQKVYLKWSPARGELEYLQERDTKRSYAVAIMNQTLKVMAEAFHAGDKEKARKTLNRTVEDVKELFPNAEEEDINQLMQQVIDYLDIITRSLKG